MEAGRGGTERKGGGRTGGKEKDGGNEEHVASYKR